MRRNLIALLILSLLLPNALKADWVPLNNSRTEKTSPKVTLLSQNEHSTVIKIEISGFEIKDLVSGGKTFQALDLLSEAVTIDPGMPELPYIAKILAIPDEASVSVEVLETGQISTFRDINLAPARASWYEGDLEPRYAENADAYRSGNIYPKEPVMTDPPAVFRDFRIARVSVFPVRYIAGKKELQVASSMTIRVNYGTGKAENPKTAAKRPIAPSFGKIYRSTIFNYQEVLNTLYGGREEGHDLVLCIMPDEFYNSFQVYADWKKQSGMDVHVTKFFEIGGNTNNPDVIKAYIADCYHNWEVPPTYVLIVGDDGVFPKKIVTYPDYSFPNEDFFVEIDGNDYFPEMMIGRFTNQGDYRMQVMINKFLMYEKTPNILNTAWFKKGTVCSNNAYESQVETKRFAASMMSFGGFTSVDTLMSDGAWGGDCTVELDDVLDAINDGRSFLNYRGEGWSDGWHATCYYFTSSDVNSLSNGEKFTFVTSIGCGVAMFDTWGANNCFGEEWVELGSLTAPRGGVCFVGPTSNTHTAYNNRIDKGIYMGMFTEGMETPGQALLRGKLYMYNVFGNEYYVEYHYKVYCILGDPSIHIWKDIPQQVNMTYPESILVGPNEIEIAINYTNGGSPVGNAQVTLSSDEFFTTGYTDAEGHVVMNITPETPDTLMVTVRGGDVYPKQGEIIVIQPAELVIPQNYPVITDIDGNLDGLLNPNEHSNVTFTLKNWGYETAENVMAILTTSDEEFIDIITTNPVSFGNLASGASFTGDPFQVYVTPDCPVGQLIPVQLHVISTTNAWDYYYTIKVNGCELEVFSYMVNDQGSASPNYRMDPGETVMLFVTVKNKGNDIAPDVLGVLTCDDPYITIEDSVSTYGSVMINGTSLSAPDHYVVTVSPSCPVNYLVDYSLKLKTFNGNYPYRTTSDFTVPVSKPVPSDYTGPDAYGYYAYSSDDYFDQAPDFAWFEIDQIGNTLNMSGMGDYTETVNLPFTFKYYGVDYNQVRISTDGWIAFGSGTQTGSVNYALPHNDNINCMVAGFWDDLYDSETVEGNIYYYADMANHRFIIEWDSIARNDFGSEPNVEIFQAVLYDENYYPTATGNGEIVFQYKQLMAPQFCTVGIENQAQNIGLQYVYNNAYDPTASGMQNGFAIKFTTEPPFASIITNIEGEDQPLPGNGYSLEQNRPNPFSSHTWITYTIPESGHVTLNIYNVNGTLVSTLHDGMQSSGSYTIRWDGLNVAGQVMSPGAYLYEIATDKFKASKKMFMLK